MNSPLEVNLGIDYELRDLFVCAKLNRVLKNHMIMLLNDFKDAFAWSYEDMPSLNKDIVVYHL